MKIPTVPGRTYVVTGVNGGEITTPEGVTVGKVSGGAQMCFIAPTTSVNISDEAALVSLSLDGSTPQNGVEGARHEDMLNLIGKMEEMQGVMMAKAEALEAEIASVRNALNEHIANSTMHVGEGERTIWSKSGEYAVKQLETAAEKEAKPGLIRKVARKIW